ncbi:MAG: hypothetical protein JWQ27_3041 [Ferruginibacter sp.]|nr:hypothetical protein [Ferruginibacter sp.]
MKNAVVVLFLLAGICIHPSYGQSDAKKYKPVDDIVQKLGALTAFNVATIGDTITRPFSGKDEKARAIFYWIANNIALDPKAIRGNDQKNSLPELVVKNRKATPLGFSLLVQEMCSMANIRCLSVDGYLKNFPEDINNKADEINHSWNVVQLGQSPEQWYYVDAARASGFLDKKMSTFTKYFTSEYFFADKALFNLDHYPDNGAWQLGGGPKSIKDFYALPVFSNASYEYGLKQPMPVSGLIKTKIKNSTTFSFNYNGAPIAKIELLIGEGKTALKPEPMNFTASGSTVSFTYQFKKEDTYPVSVVVDGKDLLQYFVEVTE